ncbi:hypothetical protein CANARDRAFT_81320 [[Candida] arabinofermentans NRRL YB-2248]|uniref:G domain-containing protein n=1 Tax=[Candida] arabinofermentans NRRL YB-2248 TaxID=983967 RepID=A0A1E4SUW0_9ASCO|nr:hypothetical protein CANARDRAFT_81320 [[Candida] arabinofermentans NRRL YB-2248]
MMIRLPVVYRTTISLSKCRRYHSSAPSYTFEKVVSSIPSNVGSKILWCLNAKDFPLGIKHKQLELVNKVVNFQDITFLITLVDLVIPQPSTTTSTEILKIYQDYYYHSLNTYLSRYELNKENVKVTSTVFKERIVNELPLQLLKNNGNHYIIGETNSGKTEFTKYLTQLTRKLSKEQYNFKISSQPLTSTKNIAIESITNNWIVVDTPGYISNEKNGIYGLVNDNDIQSKIEITSNLRSNFEWKKFKIENDGSIISINKFFFLKPPTNTEFHYRKFLFGKIKKINDDQFNQFINKKFPRLSYSKFIIPTFTGSIDIIIEGLGYIEINLPSGDSTNENWEIYIPNGLKCIVRNSLNDCILESTKSGYQVHYKELAKC